MAFGVTSMPERTPSRVMTPETVIDVGQEALLIICWLSAPLLLSALGIGLLIGLFQAATQIQEMTLSFTVSLIERIPYLIG